VLNANEQEIPAPAAPQADQPDRELELWLGPGSQGSLFESNEERREVWFRHRDRLMEMWGRRGRRPMAWWTYEAPFAYPGFDRETVVLYEAGLLGETELAELTAEWRRQFERAQEPGFEHCIGSAKPGDTFATWLEGRAAKRAHYRWAHISPTLVKLYSADYRRRSAKREQVRDLSLERTRTGYPVPRKGVIRFSVVSTKPANRRARRPRFRTIQVCPKDLGPASGTS